MALVKTVTKSLDEAKESITRSLSGQGFGILTEINVTETLKNKIDADIDPLVILGACNPNLAYQALQADRSFSLFMPCNVVLEKDGNGTKISIIDPKDIIADPQLESLAQNASDLLSQALEQA